MPNGCRILGWLRQRLALILASRLGLLTLLALGLWPLAPARANEPNACTATSATEILRSLQPDKTTMRLQAISSFDIAPIGGPMSLGIPRQLGAEKKIDNYRFIIQFGHSPVPKAKNSALSDGMQVTAVEVPETDSLRVSNRIGQGQTLLSLIVPAPAAAANRGGWGWRAGMITVVGCAGDQIVFIAPVRAVFSNRATCILLTIIATSFAYLMVTQGVCKSDNQLRPKDRQVRCSRYLDPVILSSGPNGKGSISRLQILFFSTFIFALLLYILIRIGLLSGISETVLILLGISAVGAAATKATDVGKNRLNFDNWAWMIGKRWLPKNGLVAVNLASWRDIVTADDGFDVYHFQMLIFSLVVGVALLQIGFTDLAAFSIPPTLLGVLGLSQAVYVGGKVVASPAYSDLNDAVGELRKRETAFVEAALHTTPAAGQPAQPQVPLAPPANLSEGKARAPKEYSSYIQQQDLVKPMFTSVLGEYQPDALFEPRYV